LSSNSPEVLACEQAGITVTLPKPMPSGAKSEGRFGKQDFLYLDTKDAYHCTAGQWLARDNQDERRIASSRNVPEPSQDGIDDQCLSSCFRR
jgi:hypothetical protein